jgi:hypothetical protein
MGVAPVTVKVSCKEPTCMSAFTVAVKLASIVSPSRLMVWNPPSSKLTS